MKEDSTVLSSDSNQLNLWQAAYLQLAPGVPVLFAFTAIAYFLNQFELPNMIALGLAILFVEVPISWALIVYLVKKESGGSFSLRKAFPWHAPVPWWQYLIIGIPVIIYSLIVIAGIGPIVSGFLIDTFFSMVPEWYVMRPDPAVIASLSSQTSFWIWILILVSMVTAGGITQELYSRGFLLPRTQHLGLIAPAFNALLFAVFHLISPWDWLTFFIMVLPWSFLVWWRRSVKIGLFVHVGMLLFQWIMISFLLFGLVSVPAN